MNLSKNINNEKIKEDPLSLLDEIFIDGASGEKQKFFINNEENYFCLFPIIMENLDKQNEHVLSIIYIYNKKTFYEHILKYIKESYSRLIFHLILYIFLAYSVRFFKNHDFKFLNRIHYLIGRGSYFNAGNIYHLRLILL